MFQHFGISPETKDTTTRSAEQSLMFRDCLKPRLLNSPATADRPLPQAVTARHPNSNNMSNINNSNNNSNNNISNISNSNNSNNHTNNNISNSNSNSTVSSHNDHDHIG